MADQKDVQDLAKALDDWGKGLPKEQRYLLKCLLSRGAYIEERVDKRQVVGRTGHKGVRDIRQAVVDALEPVVRKDLPYPIEGWPRFYPLAWPRMNGDWPRSGYWALGMGLPPKIDMPKIEPGKTPPVDPEGPGGLGGPPGTSPA
jgi:hypothetical protein